MTFSLPNPTTPTNGQPGDATPILQNELAIAQAIANFDGSQINAKSVTEAALADAVNPRLRYSETLSNFVQVGCVWNTLGGLAATMTGGTVYINGYRTLISAIATHTFAINSDTYVDIDYLGNVTYNAVSNNAASPALAANNIRDAKIVTNGSAISSITQSGEDSLGNVIYPAQPVGPSVIQRLVASGNGTQITGTGAIVVTGVGFNPRVIHIVANIDQTNNATHNGVTSEGVYDRIAGTQGCISTHSGNGTAGGTHSEAAVISTQAPIGTKQAEGTISATSSDGFTLNIATFGSVNTNWRWIAWA